MQTTLEYRRSAADRLGKNFRGTVSGIEVRDAASGLSLVGHACVTNVGYDMGWYTETVRSGAFAKTLGENPDVQLLVNHEGLPLARTLSGTLSLAEDSRGLAVEAHLDPNDPDVARLVPKMQRGDIDQMSFAFRAERVSWNDDYDRRDILEANIHRGDVSVVNQGANPATHAEVEARGLPSLGEFVELAREWRAGATLSASTTATLKHILSLFTTADSAVDEGQSVLSELLGVPNPDPDKPADDARALPDVALYRARLAQYRAAV